MGTKAIIGIVAAVALIGGAILLNNSSEPSKPVTDSDYAHIYYDYIQNELKPTGNFIDADMVYIEGFEAPVLVTGEYQIKDTDYPEIPQFGVYTYNNDTKQVENYAASNYLYGEYMVSMPLVLNGHEDEVTHVTIFLVDIEGTAHFASLRDYGSRPYIVNDTNGEIEYDQPWGLITVLSQANHEAMFTLYYDSDPESSYDNSKAEIQEVIDSQIGTWGISFGAGETNFFPILENTNGERLRDYFE